MGDSALVPEVAAEDSRTDAEERPFAVTVLVLTPDTLSVPDWPEAAWLCEEEERVGACLRGVATREGWLCVEDEELRVAELDRVTGVDVRFAAEEEELLRVAELLRVCDEEEELVEGDGLVLLVAELLRV